MIQCNPIKVPMAFFTENVFLKLKKFYGITKTPTAKAVGRRNKARDIILDIKVHYKALVILALKIDTYMSGME